MSPLFDLSYYFSISWEVYLPYGPFCSSVGWLDGFGLSVIISYKKVGNYTSMHLFLSSNLGKSSHWKPKVENLIFGQRMISAIQISGHRLKLNKR